MSIDIKHAREMAENTLFADGPNVIGSSSWFRCCAIEHAHQVIALLEKLAAVSAARDEACDIAEAETLDDTWSQDRDKRTIRRLNELRKVGQP